VQQQIGGKKGTLSQGTLTFKKISHWGQVQFLRKTSEQLCRKSGYTVPKK